MAHQTPYPGAPRWVKVFGIIAVVVVLLAVIIIFTGIGGGHGPGRHTPSGDAGDMPAARAAVEHQPSSGPDSQTPLIGAGVQQP